MTQIFPCGLDLAWLLMVQTVISPLDAGRGKTSRRVMCEAGGRDEKTRVVWSLGRHSVLSFVHSKSSAGDYGEENQTHQHYAVGGGMELLSSWHGSCAWSILPWASLVPPHRRVWALLPVLSLKTPFCPCFSITMVYITPNQIVQPLYKSHNRLLWRLSDLFPFLWFDTGRKSAHKLQNTT